MANSTISDGGRGAPAAVGAVLAGGAGSRIGGAKATVDLAGAPLIARPLAALAAAGIEPLVVAKPDTELPSLDCAVLREPQQPRHPLCGIVAALRAVEGRALVVVACDFPLASPALLAALATAPERLVVPAPGGRAQPLMARYSPSLLPTLEAALGREEPLRKTIAGLRPRLLGDRELARFGDSETIFVNVNDGAGLTRAASLLSGRARSDGSPKPSRRR
jgi:molybdenum cofactor guanylyltransferase